MIEQAISDNKHFNELTKGANMNKEIEKSILLERCRKGDNKAMLELSKTFGGLFCRIYNINRNKKYRQKFKKGYCKKN